MPWRWYPVIRFFAFLALYHTNNGEDNTLIHYTLVFIICNIIVPVVVLIVITIVVVVIVPSTNLAQTRKHHRQLK